MMVRVTAIIAGAAFMAFAGAVLAQPQSAGRRAIAQAAAKAEHDFPLAAARQQSPGQGVFLARCQYCHVEMGMGTLTLAKRLGPMNALLANRTDLGGDYIRYVVRHGLNSMPPINRAEVSDGELDRIVTFLMRNNPGMTETGK